MVVNNLILKSKFVIWVTLPLCAFEKSKFIANFGLLLDE